MTKPISKVVCVGVHVLDIHVATVESIPEGSSGALVETIRMSTAGTAGGTAVVLSKLGADVTSIAAVGDDPIGTVLVGLLQANGVDTGRVATKEGVQTSASVLPINGNGDRPAWHCIGANGSLTLDDIDLDVVRAADHVHVGWSRVPRRRGGRRTRSGAERRGHDLGRHAGAGRADVAGRHRRLPAVGRPVPPERRAAARADRDDHARGRRAGAPRSRGRLRRRDRGCAWRLRRDARRGRVGAGVRDRRRGHDRVR